MEKKDFEKLGIYDLRNYARNLGILSPTTLKRDELLTRIQDILNGVEKPQEKKNNKGRPPKHKNDEMYMLNLVVPDNMFDSSNTDNRYKQYVGGENLFPTFKDVFCEPSNASTKNILFKGYFKRMTEGFGLALFNGYITQYIKENVVLLNDQISKYGLVDGDYIVGACKYVVEKNIMLATDINEINDNKAIAYQDKKVDQKQNIYPISQINFNESNLVDLKIIDKICPIAKGGRVAIDCHSNDMHRFYIDFLNGLTELNNIRTLLISVDDLPEEIFDIADRCPKVEICDRKIGTSREQYLSKLDLQLKNYKRRYLDGQDVAIVFYNINKLANNFRDNIILSGKSQAEAEILAKNEITDTFMIASSSNNGSITTMAFGTDFDAIKQFASCKIILMPNCYKDTDIDVDLKNSFTNNVDKIFDNDTIKKLNNFKNNFTNENVNVELNKLFE